VVPYLELPEISAEPTNLWDNESQNQDIRRNVQSPRRVDYNEAAARAMATPFWGKIPDVTGRDASEHRNKKRATV
jgi:hypothetical protein